MSKNNTETQEEKPNPITKAIIDSTVDRGIREIEEDPKRSLRKLTDMARLFNKGRFLDEVLGMVQDLLRNDDSPYYTTIENTLRNVSRQNIKDFGINFGYCGLTFGGKKIREIEPTVNFHIPWSLNLRIDTRSRDSMTVDEIQNCIIQGKLLGIYVYVIKIAGNCSCLHELCKVMQNAENCAFLILMPDCLLQKTDLAEMKECTSTMFLFPAETQSVMQNVEAMKSQKSLYGIYSVYGNDDAAEWCSGRKTASLMKYSPAFALLVSDDTASQRCCRRVAKYCRTERMHPEYPIVLFDQIGDFMQVYKTVSEDREGLFLELLENGDIKTDTEIITDFRHTVSLRQIFEIALPRAAEEKSS
ncbi:MAG: hypothetical protein SOI56_02730 [Eubacteriales bacterium]|jgi:hypothetical protein